MSALVGLDPWANASDVYLEKTDQVAPRADKDTGVKKIGNVFESAVIDLFAETRGVVVKRNIFLNHEMFCSNLDGLIEAEHEIVEAKTTGKVEEWGEQYTDDIPERNIVQVHEQMFVVSKATGKECRVAWVPVLLPGYQNLEFRIYRVERDDDLIENLISVGTAFWNKHVVARVPPDPFQPSMELIKRVRREPNKVVDIPDSLVLDWITADVESKKVGKLAEAAKSKLLAALGDAEAGDYSLGRVTYFEQQRAGFTVAPTSFRVLRLPKAKIKKRS